MTPSTALCPDPFFIIGTERSGSNLLREMMDAHSALAVPHPPHIMHYFRPLQRYYGDLEDDRNMRRLVQDVLRLLRVHINPWPVVPDWSELLTRLEERTVYGLSRALYQLRAEHDGKRRWGCKSTFMVHHVDEVLATTPRAKFVWLVRDPRDVAVSSRGSVFSPCHPYLTAKLWASQQREAYRVLRSHGEDRVELLRYEDLVAEPEACLRRLCRFLGEEYEPAMLKYHRREQVRRSAALSRSWRNTAYPPSTRSVGRFSAELDREEVAMVEAVAGRLMDELGYERTSSGAGRATVSGLAISIKELQMRAEVEWHSMRSDANHWRRWARDSLVWTTGVVRRGQWAVMSRR